ncbi:uncharacterized protein OCT59_011822 [Rhizophagus irregularis]|nr:hypothetical protein OCT59_011822 [Rhizophagus irregularis]GBC39478.1 kinase-like domain-containing protein [Rhizophagus irregularis DAOM 181602=DAOM 197198]
MITDKSSRLVGVTSGNISIDNFIKATRKNKSNIDKCMKWFEFEKFENLKQIGEGGFAKVYSATWLHGGKKFIYTDPVTKTKKIRTYPNTVALKSIKGSNEISAEYLNELEVYHKLTLDNVSLPFYGITKDPNSSEFMMVTNLAEQGCLRSLLGERFTELNWQYKLLILLYIVIELKILHEQGICHKDLHSGNILRSLGRYYLTDFGLSGPSNKSSDKIYGVLGYLAPEVLKGKQYCSHADIYSFGVMMTELSSGFPPYFNKSMSETTLALSICDGLRPDFGKGTPEIYRSLANKCMNANPDKRPTASELEENMLYLYNCLCGNISGDDAKKIKVEFDIADKEIPNVQSLFKKSSKDSNLMFVSKQLGFNDIIETSVYDNLDSGLIGLNLSDDIGEDNEDDDNED